MGLSYAELEIANYDDVALARRDKSLAADVRRMKVKLLADTGALMLALNEDISAQLGLEKVEERLAELADGSTQSLDVVGPVELRFGNRRTVACAMVLPGDSEPLLGRIPMDDMDLIVEPKTQRIIIDPSMPYISRKSMK